MFDSKYKYIPKSLPSQSCPDNPDFFQNLQKSLFSSLYQKDLLSEAQYQECQTQLESHHLRSAETGNSPASESGGIPC